MDLSQFKTKQRAVDLLEKELSGFRCLVCGKDDFRQLDRLEQNLETNNVLYEGDDPVGRKHFPLFTIACTHCGRIEQFAQQPLIERVRSEMSDE